MNLSLLLIAMLSLPSRGAWIEIRCQNQQDKEQTSLPSRGATLTTQFELTKHTYFNPRSPRGERLSSNEKRRLGGYFNPRSPRGERLTVDKSPDVIYCISIHAPREGSDIYCWATYRASYLFQSTLPARGAT